MSTPPPDAGTPPVTPTPDAAVLPVATKKSKLPWILGGAALAVILLVVVAVVVVFNVIVGAAKGPQEVIGAYDRAFDTVDCELYLSITTEAYQESFEPTCEGFESIAQNFVDTYSDYQVAVTGTSVTGDTATVTTSETYVLDGEPGTDLYTYHLVNSGGSWLIDRLDLQ
ncbi:hypothetical protein [Pseudolysinimonas sp.]|uniref:hypothetical protein n=1 Tax=Pseudolysinimonas sp. TaxID=2680009 RepID=UPI00286A8E7E|nr:hypothetical protein [Pseudolysinimonas sp.]